MELDAKKMSDRMNAVIYYVVPPCIFVLGLYYSYDGVVFAARGEPATARITRVEKYSEFVNGDRRNKTDWHINYQTADGTHQRGKVSAELFVVRRAGDEIEVLYDPGKPERVKVNSFFSLWGIPIMFGVPVLLVFGYLIRKRFKQKSTGTSERKGENREF